MVRPALALKWTTVSGGDAPERSKIHTAFIATGGPVTTTPAFALPELMNWFRWLHAASKTRRTTPIFPRCASFPRCRFC